ncbi:PREDICTED: uncharacterized protein LOC102823017 [Chrysochloris asiatica]|uniref:Uncharacterized protein LOC102823017 n=1 Tax=Chrysochloris asiatica TaxID=185453 RepID=A0A9B0WWS4_CHRAS|nr:PREDICTED: uncharacterized protein LOC102823017 [Chrysochloris asiatica]
MERPDTTPEGGHPSRGHPVRRGGQAQRQKEGGSKGALQVRIQEREAPGAEMGTRVGAAVAVGLWVSVTMGVASDLGVREPQRCLLFQDSDQKSFLPLTPSSQTQPKSESSRERLGGSRDGQGEHGVQLSLTPAPECSLGGSTVGPQVQEDEMRQRSGGPASSDPCPQEEETLSWRPRNCSFRPWKELPKPGSCARLRLVARDLADAQLVLSSQRNSELLPGTGPTLQLLAAARRDVGTCLELFRPGSSRKSLGPPRRRHKARRDESPRCREAAVILTLLRLLLRDLRLVAHSEPCV